MNIRTLARSLFGVLGLAALAGVLLQHRQLSDLRREAQRLRKAQAVEQTNTITVTVTPAVAKPEPVDQLTDEEKSQLLRLRGEVTLLLNRQRELAGVRAENDQLRAQLAASRTNASAATGLPPGYVLRSQAQWAGLATPEDTMQSFLWALRNRDFTNLLQTLTPESAQKLEQSFQRAGGKAGDLFDTPFPGLAILSRKSLPDGSIEATVEIAPGITIPKFRFQQVGGQWKMAWPN